MNKVKVKKRYFWLFTWLLYIAISRKMKIFYDVAKGGLTSAALEKLYTTMFCTVSLLPSTFFHLLLHATHDYEILFARVDEDVEKRSLGITRKDCLGVKGRCYTRSRTVSGILASACYG